MPSILFAHLIVPSIVLVLLAIAAIYLSNLTFNKGRDCGWTDARAHYANLVDDQKKQIQLLLSRINTAHDQAQRMKRNAALAIQQAEERHQRQLAILEQQHEELERNGIVIERREAGEIINLLRLASPLLHAGQQQEAARSADSIRVALQKKLLQLRLVENESAAAGEGTV